MDVLVLRRNLNLRRNPMRNANNLKLAAAILFIAVASVFLAFVYTVRANPSDLNLSNAVATTTVTYLTAAGASTTETYDSYGGGVGEPNASEKAVLFTNFAASSTSSVLAIKVQYSQNGIDWFDDNLMESTNSTTTPLYNLGTSNSYTWTAIGTATSSKTITIPTPTRYVRAVYSVTGANAAVYKVIIAKKEQP